MDPMLEDPWTAPPTNHKTFGRFYLHFAAAYGTFWLALFSAALIGQTHIDAGGFGLFGFPILAAVYSVIRIQKPTPEGLEIARLRGHLRDIDRRDAR